MICLEVE
jgi:hypothetical protein